MSSRPFPRPSFSQFDGDVTRIVESQEHVATTKIVGDLAEQDLLEQMLEDNKPSQLEPGLHYLLATPFRYPPLRHGSRFGSSLEPSLFYASLELTTCLHECAYYRFVFWHDMAAPPPTPITTQHTVFDVALHSAACIDLRAKRYQPWHEELTSAVNYNSSQALGASLREHSTELILFRSARCHGTNAAAFSPQVFSSRPKHQEQWQSELSSARVLFRGPGGLFRFELAQFADTEGALLRA